MRFRRLVEGVIFPNRKRKALLIGICHEDDEDTITLKGPHHDVERLKKLLMSKLFARLSVLSSRHIIVGVYRYKEEDITIMRDGAGVASHLVPTRKNIVSTATIIVMSGP